MKFLIPSILWLFDVSVSIMYLVCVWMCVVYAGPYLPLLYNLLNNPFSHHTAMLFIFRYIIFAAIYLPTYLYSYTHYYINLIWYNLSRYELFVNEWTKCVCMIISDVHHIKYCWTMGLVLIFFPVVYKCDGRISIEWLHYVVPKLHHKILIHVIGRYMQRQCSLFNGRGM